MIDTTELRRLRDGSGNHGATIGMCGWPFVKFANDNAHAIADELDALREWKAIEQQHLISSATALVFAGWRGDGSVTDAVKWACSELDELRKHVAELESALRTIKHHRAPEKDYCREIVAMAEKALS